MVKIIWDAKLHNYQIVFVLVLGGLILILALGSYNQISCNFSGWDHRSEPRRPTDRVSATDQCVCSWRAIPHHLSQFIKLKKLLRWVFCCKAISAPVERLFSQSRLIMRPHRARMTDQLLETGIFKMHRRCINKCEQQHLFSVQTLLARFD